MAVTDPHKCCTRIPLGNKLMMEHSQPMAGGRGIGHRKHRHRVIGGQLARKYSTWRLKTAYLTPFNEELILVLTFQSPTLIITLID
jgi:hypothetical protein